MVKTTLPSGNNINPVMADKRTAIGLVCGSRDWRSEQVEFVVVDNSVELGEELVSISEIIEDDATDTTNTTDITEIIIKIERHFIRYQSTGDGKGG